MQYESTRAIANRWGVSVRYVQRLLAEGRVCGARRFGRTWLAPAGAQRPADARRRAPETDVGPSYGPHAGKPSSVSVEPADAAIPADSRSLVDFESVAPHVSRLYLLRLQGAIDEVLHLVECIDRTTLATWESLMVDSAIASCALFKGDGRAWLDALHRIERTPAVTPQLTMIRELFVAETNLGLHGRTVYPEWLRRGRFEGLPHSMYPMARYAYCKLLYMQYRELDMLAVVEPLICECRRDRAGLSELYLRIIAAAGYWEYGNTSFARDHLRCAIALAKPEGIIAPFVEYRSAFASMLDRTLGEAWPEVQSVIKRTSSQFIANWTNLFNGIWDECRADSLTPRELEACMLSVRGCSTSIIARRMGVSENSVKKYLALSYAKLGIHRRADLASALIK